MSEIHSGPVHAPDVEGQCTWRHDSFGQHLRCEDLPTIGELLCEFHQRQATEESAR